MINLYILRIITNKTFTYVSVIIDRIWFSPILLLLVNVFWLRIRFMEDTGLSGLGVKSFATVILYEAIFRQFLISS